jgi:hypothetical protein
VPSDPGLGASTISNLRLACTESGADFIETGGEVEGVPYDYAMAQILQLERDGTSRDSQATAPSPAFTPIPDPDIQPAPSPVPPIATSETLKAGNAIIPAKAEELVAQPIHTQPKSPETSEEPQPPEESRRVQPGPGDKTATIRMKAPPALRRFSPNEPVNRRDVNSKVPAVSR